MPCCNCNTCGSGSLCATGLTADFADVIMSTTGFDDAYVNAYLAITNNTSGDVTVTVTDGSVIGSNPVPPGTSAILQVLGTTEIMIEGTAGESGTFDYQLSYNANLPCPTGPGPDPG